MSYIILLYVYYLLMYLIRVLDCYSTNTVDSLCQLRVPDCYRLIVSGEEFKKAAELNPAGLMQN